MSESKKLPAMQWYPGDWRKDPAVQSMDYETRGVWFEMLNIMWDLPERGMWSLNGTDPMPVEAGCRLLSLDQAKYQAKIAKIVDFGAAKVKQNSGIIFSRRQMEFESERRKKAEISAKRAKAGKIGGSRSRSKSKAKVKQPGGSSSSTSSSSSTTEHREETEIKPSLIQKSLSENGKISSEGDGSEDGSDSDRQQQARRKAGRLLKGREGMITNTAAARSLCELLAREMGLGIEYVWSAVCNARKADNPAGVLVNLISCPKWPPSKSYREQARKEMRQAGIMR